VEAHLRKALQNDEFKLYYQPKYNLQNEEIIGAEILLRWNNEVLGPISPNEFIPIAESTGLMVALGQWILRKACEQVMKWTNEYDSMLSFSINISPIQLLHNQFIPNLEKTLQDYNYPAEYLEFEITETLLMRNDEEINKALHKISALGIKLSLDDFGKGYSSLNRLKTLPIDALKIDKEFVSDIHDDKQKVAIIDIIIKLASELGMSITAEGIETTPQLKYLKSKKCLLGQGFLLSEPLPPEEFAKLAYANWTKKKVIVIAKKSAR
jgi:EAL domain-containing protein (putative c-di-GMP-specific phosphodiesterase class I)